MNTFSDNTQDVTLDAETQTLYIGLAVGVGLAVAALCEVEAAEKICDRCGAPPADCVCSRGGD